MRMLARIHGSWDWTVSWLRWRVMKSTCICVRVHGYIQALHPLHVCVWDINVHHRFCDACEGSSSTRQVSQIKQLSTHPELSSLWQLLNTESCLDFFDYKIGIIMVPSSFLLLLWISNNMQNVNILWMCKLSSWAEDLRETARMPAGNRWPAFKNKQEQIFATALTSFFYAPVLCPPLPALFFSL